MCREERARAEGDTKTEETATPAVLTFAGFREGAKNFERARAFSAKEPSTSHSQRSVLRYFPWALCLVL